MIVSEARRRAIVASAIAIGCVAGGAAPARAANFPNGAVMRVGRTIDVVAFARAVATRYHVVLRRVVAADIDRDGDLDVLATSDLGFLIWVNDGAGRLTSQTPTYRPLVDRRSPGDTWDGARSRDDETIQNDVPSPRLPVDHAHAPPAAVSQPAVEADARPCLEATYGDRTPRAPPLL